MLLKDFSIQYYIIINAYNSRSVVYYLVGVHLVHILGHHKDRWHPQKMVPAQMGFKGSQQR